MFKTKRRVVACIGVLALVAVSVAVAAWIVTASGPGGATKLGSLPAGSVTVTNAPSPTGAVFPGNSNVPTQLSITNSNAFPVSLTSVQLATAGPTMNISGAAGGATCTSGNIALTAGSNQPITTGGAGEKTITPAIVVAPGTSVVSVPNFFQLGASSDTSCQGATVTLGGASSFTWIFSP